MSDDIAYAKRGAGPESASGRFLIRMEPGLHAALREAAAAIGVSLNAYCVRKIAQPGITAPESVTEVVVRAAAVAREALVGVVVFGSWARGLATSTSDVDALVVVDERLPITRALYEEWAEAPLKWEGLVVEPHFVRMPGAGEAISGLWAEVAIEGLVLFERDLELSRRLAERRRRIASGEMVRRWSNGHPYWVTVTAGRRADAEP